MVSKEATEQTAPAADSGLSDYEMVVLINPELADENFEAAVNNISRFITERGGSITSIDKWGKKKLSYPIKRFKEASYIMVRFKFKPGLSKELEATLRITENVLRHLLLKLES